MSKRKSRKSKKLTIDRVIVYVVLLKELLELLNKILERAGF
jgi:hypothetical protein